MRIIRNYISYINYYIIYLNNLIKMSQTDFVLSFIVVENITEMFYTIFTS